MNICIYKKIDLKFDNFVEFVYPKSIYSRIKKQLPFHPHITTPLQ